MDNLINTLSFFNISRNSKVKNTYNLLFIIIILKASTTYLNSLIKGNLINALSNFNITYNLLSNLNIINR